MPDNELPDNELPGDELPAIEYRQPAPHHIDVDAVLRRSRRRRVPGQLAVALVSTLAVVGLLGGGVYGLAHLPESSSGSSTSAGAEVNPQAKPVPATPDPNAGEYKATAGKNAVGRCGRAPVPTIATPNGLEVTVTAPDARAGQTSIAGVVTLTNTGTARVRGTTEMPLLTLVHNGVVVWHSDNITSVKPFSFDLAPGKTLTFHSTFSAVRCGVGDEKKGQLRTELPAASPGEYQLYATLSVSLFGDVEAVGGPPITVNLS